MSSFWGPVQHPIYNKQEIYFDSLKHLDKIGLISLDTLGHFIKKGLPQKYTTSYYGQRFELEFPNPENNDLDTGRALLSLAGQELAAICEAEPLAGFADYVIQHWRGKGIKVNEIQAVDHRE